MTACCHYAYGTLPGRNAPLSTTCLPLICAKNRRNRLKITTIALLKNAAKSGFFAFYSRPHQVCGLIQFPYGSPFDILGNSVISPFPSFSLSKTSLPYFSPHTSLRSFFAALKYSRIFTSAGSICNAKDILPSSEFMYFSGVMSAPLKNRLWETPYFSQ